MAHPLMGRKQTPEHVAKRIAALKGKPKSANHKAKLAAALTGRKQSPEEIAKVVASVKLWREQNPKRVAEIKANRSARFVALNKSRSGKPMSEKNKTAISAANKGKVGIWMKGRKMPEITRRKIAAYWAANPEKHNNYKDGKGHERSGARIAEMQRIEYRLWREKVFMRDNHTCQWCGQHGGRLHADHIKPYILRPDLKHDVSNGRTLCRSCHYKTDTHGAKVWKSAAARELFALCIGG